MRLTTKGRYAVTAMLDIALHSDGDPVSVMDIAERQDISSAYLEQLFSKLKRSGLLQSASALIATFLSLVITVLVSDGLNIEGAFTWVIATVLVWLLTMVAGVLLAKLLLKDAPSKN